MLSRFPSRSPDGSTKLSEFRRTTTKVSHREETRREPLYREYLKGTRDSRFAKLIFKSKFDRRCGRLPDRLRCFDLYGILRAAGRIMGIYSIENLLPTDRPLRSANGIVSTIAFETRFLDVEFSTGPYRRPRATITPPSGKLLPSRERERGRESAKIVTGRYGKILNNSYDL